MIAPEEHDQIRSHISRVEDQIGVITAEVGQLDTKIARLRDEIGDENEVRRDWGHNSTADLQIRRDITRMESELDKLYENKRELIKRRDDLFELKKELYWRLDGHLQ